MFNPAFVTVRRGDTGKLTAFVVNGDEHEVWVTDPKGREVVPKTDWNRGRQYEVRIEHGAIRATDLRKIKVSDEDFGLMNYDPAFMDTVVSRLA